MLNRADDFSFNVESCQNREALGCDDCRQAAGFPVCPLFKANREGSKVI
jgi:hypothetical protein